MVCTFRFTQPAPPLLTSLPVGHNSYLQRIQPSLHTKIENVK